MPRNNAILRRIRSDEGGFSLVELVVAASLMAGGLVAVIGVFDGSRQLVTHAERRETATHQADQELERVLAMDYAQVGHLSGQAPVPSSDANNPDFFVRSGGVYQYDHANSSRTETLVTSGGTLGRYRTWVDGRLTGRAYRYVTWIYDDQLVQSPTDVPDAKRVTVAVTVTGGDRRIKPIVTSSIVYDRRPEETP